MDGGSYFFGALMIGAIIFAVIEHMRTNAFKERIEQIGNDGMARINAVSSELESVRTEVKNKSSAINELIAGKTEAETRVDELRKTLNKVIEERDSAILERESSRQEKVKAEMEVALRVQELKGMEARMSDWEKVKDEGIKAAQAATLSAAMVLSTKVLDDHKREAAAAKKEDEERIKKTTENLFGQVREVTNIVAALQSQVTESKTKTETIWRALSTPGGSGHSTQVILGNTLKSLGLEEYRDFVLDKAPEGKRRRPDAIVFLPGDTVLVIDAKASKFLLEVAEAEKNGSDETEALENLARTMSQHLKELVDKNYEAEVRNSYREAGRMNEAKIIMSLMYLPNEGAIERVGKADPTFADRALERQIVIVGPTALRTLIGLASMMVDSGRRVEFQTHIVETTQNLLNNLHIVLDHANRVGKGLKSASESYVKLVGSVNARLLPQVKRLIQQGVKPVGHKGAPKNLPIFQVLISEDGQLIEAEAEEVDAIPSIENLSKNENDENEKDE